jgi:hypothetical protein
MDEYTKQLEEENAALKKRLEEADLKAECYDFIMNNLVDCTQGGFANKSQVTNDKIVLFMKADVKKNNIPSMKIANDMIEDEKMMQGFGKRK